MTASYRTLRGLDAKWVAAGQYPLTPFWDSTARRFYESDASTLVGRVGRGGAKSHTSVKIAINETLFGDWKVPPGERHYWAFVSKNKDEAAQRFLLIQKCLSDLGIGFDAAGDEIALRDMPRGFRVFACQIGAVSGFRCYGYSADELAKWVAGTDYSNPAFEVCASLNAMTVTHPGARRLLISSPFSADDYHAQCFDRGNGEGQIVAHAASWEANPSITEAQTKALERDPKIWAREYAAIPQAARSAAFDADAIERAFLPREGMQRGRRILVLDPSSGRKDAWTWGFCGWDQPFDAPPDAPPTLTFDGLDAVEGRFFEQMPADRVVDRIASVLRGANVREVHSDQRESYLLQSAFERRGFQFVAHAWTSPAKIEAVERVRRLLADRRLALPTHAKLRTELLSFEEKINPTGAITFGARGTGHDDFVALLLTGVMAIGDGEPNPMIAALTRVVNERKACGGSFDLGEHYRGFGLL